MNPPPVKRPTVLCVDDEPRVLEGLKTTLRGYEVLTANGGADGLAMLKHSPSVNVVVSDMRMPEMDGAAFLAKVCERWPDITRILLTGDSGREVAVHAINEGRIFRFLTKPCAPEKLLTAVKDGVRQNELVTAEKELLQKTLLGSIRALVDVLGLVNPVAFGRGSRIKRLTVELATALGLNPGWELEAAALLSQIGYVSLPTELVEKAQCGEPLNEAEQLLIAETPKVTQGLLARIPRLENVAAILAHAVRAGPVREPPSADIGNAALVLMAVLEFDALTSQGETPQTAIATMRARWSTRDIRVLEHLASLQGVSGTGPEVTEMRLRDVVPGMILMDDLRTDLGTLLVTRGYEVTQSFVERMRNFGPGLLQERIRVQVPAGGVSRVEGKAR
jgi:response regulator RpfG family c-di-GMP phosphodiesterase